MKFELICIDMFQTLVDVNTRRLFIWKRILKEQYNERLALECARSVAKNVFNKFHESVSENKEFINLKVMFNQFFYKVLKEMNIHFDAKEAVKIFMEEHTNAESYADVEHFFSLIGDSLPICLVSDADYEMIFPILKRYKFDEVFISEKVQSYKNETNSRIFREVLKHYSIDPSKVIHIGDSLSDIVGANRIGIKTCWINRQSEEWRYTPKPDYIVKSLDEVIAIIDGKAI